eukprot:12404243-Alexandrium_andersonii.AAC.1
MPRQTEAPMPPTALEAVAGPEPESNRERVPQPSGLGLGRCALLRRPPGATQPPRRVCAARLPR